jgi:hypothetical protein
MPSKVVPNVWLPPLVHRILSDLYGEFRFVNTPFFPLAATSAVDETTVCRWYREDNGRPLRAALAFNACEDTLLFADVYMRVDDGRPLALADVRIKLRCITDIERLGCERCKAVALVSTETEWRNLAETVLQPLIAYAVERDRALGF